MRGTFETRSVPLKFRIGEVTLFTIKLDLSVCTTHFLKLLEHGDEDSLFAEIKPGTSGTLVRSLPVKERLPRVSRLKNALRYVPSQYRRFYVDLDLDDEAYLKTFSGKSRSTLKRKAKRFAKLSGGEIEWKAYRTPEEMKEYYRMARDISKLTYQEKLLDAGLPAHEAFQKNMLDLAAEDRVRGYLLFLDEKAISYLYSPIRDGVVRYEYLGYDPEHAKVSPGVVLQWLALQSLFEEPDLVIFDFLEGETMHKKFFATHDLRCADVFYLRKTLKNILYVYLHAGLDLLGETVGKMLDQWGLKARIRKMIRGRGAGSV